MLDNLKFALIRHKKFLVIFFVVIFLPSLLLAAFGIRAIRNERYKVQQRNLEQQRDFLAYVESEIAAYVEQSSADLRQLSSNPAFHGEDFQTLRSVISMGRGSEKILGEIVFWKENHPPWLPAFQERPPAGVVTVVPNEWREWGPELEKAEELEFRRHDYSGAVSQYRRLLSQTRDRRIACWILSRVARCEAKTHNYKQAVALYRSLVDSYSDLVTESGRPLEIASRFGALDVFLAESDLDT